MADERSTAGVPDDVAAAVAAFLRARLSTAERWTGTSAGSADWRDQMTLIREWEQARGLHRWVTADNLALTMLTTAVRYRTHPGYDPVWDTLRPFGDLQPPPGRISRSPWPDPPAP